jgi:hypothetical protein
VRPPGSFGAARGGAVPHHSRRAHHDATHRPAPGGAAQAEEGRPGLGGERAGAARRAVRRDVDADELHLPVVQLSQPRETYYDLISNIAAEEFGHIELVSASINLLLNGDRSGFDDKRDPTGTPLADGQEGGGNRHHFIASGQTALP